MAEVTTRKTKKTIEVLLDGDVIHQAGTDAEAAAIAQWVTFQVERGTSATDLERMLRGEPPKKATGYSGGLVVEVAEEEAPRPEKKRSKAKAKAAEPDLSILDGRVTKVKKMVENGDCDDWLVELRQAEEEGKGRKTVLGAIEDRLAEIG